MLKTLKLMPVTLVSGIFALGTGDAVALDQYAGVSLGQAEVSDFCDGASAVGVECDDKAFTGRITAGGFIANPDFS